MADTRYSVAATMRAPALRFFRRGGRAGAPGNKLAVARKGVQ
jgi:hypothetical protein